MFIKFQNKIINSNHVVQVRYYSDYGALEIELSTGNRLTTTDKDLITDIQSYFLENFGISMGVAA